MEQSPDNMAELYSYNRSWSEIEEMMDKAEAKLHTHEMGMRKYKQRMKSREFMYHARNFKALQGVVKTLQWTLGHKDIDNPLN